MHNENLDLFFKEKLCLEPGQKDKLLGKILNRSPGMMFDVLSLLEEPLNPEPLVHLSELQGDREDMLWPVPAALHKYHGVHAVLRLGRGGVVVGPGCMEQYLCS